MNDATLQLTFSSSHAPKPLLWLKTIRIFDDLLKHKTTITKRFLLNIINPRSLSLLEGWVVVSKRSFLVALPASRRRWRHRCAMAQARSSYCSMPKKISSSTAPSSFRLGECDFRCWVPSISAWIGRSFGDLGCVVGVVSWVVWVVWQLNFIVAAGFCILGFGLPSFPRAAFAHLWVWFEVEVVCLGAPVSVSVSAEFRVRVSPDFGVCVVWCFVFFGGRCGGALERELAGLRFLLHLLVMSWIRGLGCGSFRVWRFTWRIPGCRLRVDVYLWNGDLHLSEKTMTCTSICICWWFICGIHELHTWPTSSCLIVIIWGSCELAL